MLGRLRSSRASNKGITKAARRFRGFAPGASDFSWNQDFHRAYIIGLPLPSEVGPIDYLDYLGTFPNHPESTFGEWPTLAGVFSPPPTLDRSSPASFRGR